MRAELASDRRRQHVVLDSSPEYRATQGFYRSREEPVEVLVKGSLQKLVLSSDITRLVGRRAVCRATSPERPCR